MVAKILSSLNYKVFIAAYGYSVMHLLYFCAVIFNRVELNYSVLPLV
jgi:hypothetical protein